MRKTLHDFCMEQGDAALLQQWDVQANGAVTPHSISYGSRKKVWWHCKKDHHWQAAVYTRTGNGAGCPYCAGKKIAPGENSLADVSPLLASQWHPTRNGALTPADVLPGTHKKIWWRCDQGHEWQAAVNSRSAGCGCPICTNRKLLPGENDLSTAYPELARQWHPGKNGSLRPQQVLAGSKKRVWWRCDRGHEWQAAILARTSNQSGCPVCAGKTVLPGETDLASLLPELAAQWNYARNAPLPPEQVTPYSNQRVWWRCELGHEWQAVIASRVSRNAGCPYCAGRKVLAGFNDLSTLEPKVAAQWHPDLNGGLTPEMVTPGSRKKVWWQCSEGHAWKAVVYSRAGAQKCGCPVCAGKVKESRRLRYGEQLAGEDWSAQRV